MIFNEWIWRSLSWSKIPCVFQTISKIEVRFLWPTSTTASPNDRRIGYNSIGLTIPGKRRSELAKCQVDHKIWRQFLEEKSRVQ